MQQEDAFLTAYSEAQELLDAARLDQIQETLRLLACQVAYCDRYHERPSLEELAARIADAPKDAAGMEIVTNGMVHLTEVLRMLNVKPTESTS